MWTWVEPVLFAFGDRPSNRFGGYLLSTCKGCRSSRRYCALGTDSRQSGTLTTITVVRTPSSWRQGVSEPSGTSAERQEYRAIGNVRGCHVAVKRRAVETGRKVSLAASVPRPVGFEPVTMRPFATHRPTFEPASGAKFTSG